MFRFRGLLFEIDNVVLIVLEILFAEVVDDWLAILLLFVCAFVSVRAVSEKTCICRYDLYILSKVIRSRECFVA